MKPKFGCVFYLLINLLFDFVSLAIGQTSPNTKINFLDKQFEQETYYHDLSYLNSNFVNYDAMKNKFASKERSGAPTNKHNCNQIKQIPAHMRSEFKLSYFYQKYAEAYGIPVLGSSKVSSSGLRRACYVLRFFLSNDENLKAVFYKRYLRIVVLATNEDLFTVSEYNSLPVSFKSLRGLSATTQIPLITVAEENVQCSNDKAKADDLLLHQLSYSAFTLNGLDANKLKLLNAYFEEAKQNVLLSQSFSLIDPKEYFASAVDEYFNAVEKQSSASIQFRRYNSKLIDLVRSIFPCNNPYLNKCKSNRDLETLQVLRLGSKCESETGESTIDSSTQFANVLKQVSNERIGGSTRVAETSSTATPTTPSTRRTTLAISPWTPTSKGEQVTVQNPTISSRLSTTLSTTKSSTWPEITRSVDIISEAPKLTKCVDTNEKCEQWAAKGQCQRNRQFMSVECRFSCNLCFDQSTTTKRIQTTTRINISIFENLCKDEFAHCPIFASRGDCKTNPHHMLDKCKRSCNLCGDLVHLKDRVVATTSRKANTATRSNISYNQFNQAMSTRNKVDTSTSKTQNDSNDSDNECKDLVSHCLDLSKRGDCVSNEDTMRYYCAQTCALC